MFNPRALGPLPSVQIVAPADSETHELLTQPVRESGAPAPLTNHGGRVIVAPKLVNVYLNKFPDDMVDFDAFTKSIVEDGFLDATKEFGGNRGTFLGSVQADIALSATVNDTALQDFLHGLLDAKKVPASDDQTCYALVMPANSIVQWDQVGSGSASCTTFCGYHTKSSRGVYYWVTCDTVCGGCHGSFTESQARMMVHAHELGEWVTDPDGTAWYNDQTGAENGDECAWQAFRWGPKHKNWWVQPLATNSAGCLVPPYVAPTPTPVPVPVPQTNFMPAGDFAPVWAFLLQNGATPAVMQAILNDKPGGYGWGTAFRTRGCA